MHMWMWSGITYPSTIFDSLCVASSWNTSTSCLLNAPYLRFLRRFGMNTTWYLQSQRAWLRLWYSFIVNPISWSRFQIHDDRRIGQTLVSPPAEPGAYLMAELSSALRQTLKHSLANQTPWRDRTGEHLLRWKLGGFSWTTSPTCHDDGRSHRTWLRRPLSIDANRQNPEACLQDARPFLLRR